MSDFDISLDGLASLQAEFEGLEERAESDAVFEVVNNAEYAPPLEFGRGPITAGDNIRGLGTPGPSIPGGISGDEPQALRFEIDGEVIYRASVSGHPPYPFFRPAIWELQNSDVERFVRGNIGKDFESVETTTGALRLVSLALERQVKINANANQGGRSPGTHSDHPVVQTGNLVASTSSQRIR